MKWARMEALGLTVPLSDCQFFSDDGFVKDPQFHRDNLSMKYGFDNNGWDVKNGGCSVFTFQKAITRPLMTLPMTKKTYVHIYYLDKDERTNVFVRGHEEVHALHHLGKMKYFFKDIIARRYLPPVRHYLSGDMEYVADFGGIQALKKNGYDPEVIFATK
jgi:hypothetical protein